MRYYRIRDKKGDLHLTAEAQDGTLTDLTSLNEEVTDFRDLLRASYISGLSVDEIARHILSTGSAKTYDLDSLVEASKTGTGDASIIRPLDPDEMWAGGPNNYPVPPDVVDKMPEAAKMLYNSERPAMIFKGTSSRLVGPYDNVGNRSDTERTSAEGELVLVIYKGRLVAFSTGQEVAGGLLGQSMWWAAAGKVFKGCASLGPCVVTPESLPNPRNLKAECVIIRNGQELSRSTGVTALRRSPEDMVKWTVSHDTPPDLSIFYTGGIVGGGPTQAGDVVRISMEGIGYVENTVEMV